MIKIICIGKIKELFFQDAIKEYQKRLSKYTKLEIIEIPDESNLHIETVLEKEKEKIIKHIDARDYIIVLDIDGDMLDSVSLSNKLNQLFINGNSNLTFIIGGSHGIHREIKEQASYKLSFSKLTFPHQLFRVILLEQIYRSYKILNNETYHK